jgi:hypothetical protein
MAEGRKFDFLLTMTGEEIERLGVLFSQVDRSVHPPLPWYATDIMPPCLTEEHALQHALQNSAPHPPPPPPPSPATPAYIPPFANWPWQVPDFVVLDDDEEK